MPLGRAHAAEHTAISRSSTAHGDDRQAHTEGNADHRWAAETGWAPAQPDA